MAAHFNRLALFLLVAWGPSVPASAQVFSGVAPDGVLLLSNFKTLETPALVAGPVLTIQAMRAPVRLTSGALRIPDELRALIDGTARRHGLDPKLLHAVISVESGYNVEAISQKGARGLMQLMPATAQRFGAIDVHNATQNLDAGARYLKWLLSFFSGNLELALAGYNAGENAVVRAGYRIPAMRETQRYVPKVIKHYVNLL